MKKKNVSIIQMNKYERVEVSTLLSMGNKFVTNGVDNDFFYTLDDRYFGSPTNHAVIDSYVNYIMGKGLKAVSGISQESLDKILNWNDLKNIILELKKTGNSPIQVVPSQSGKKIAKLYSLPTKRVAIVNQADLSKDPLKYWFCYDWKAKNKFKPYEVESFTNPERDKGQTSIYYLRLNQSEPLFSMPDWISGIQFAEMEEEISNFVLTHIQNNFSSGKIVNIYQGESEDEEDEEEAVRVIKSQLGGTKNAGGIIVAINHNETEKTEVENIEITDAYQQFDFVSKYSKEQIFTSHSVTSPSLFGADSDTGFSSDAEQMKTALDMLYRSQINPSRSIVIEAIKNILGKQYENLDLEFEDFDSVKQLKTT